MRTLVSGKTQQQPKKKEEDRYERMSETPSTATSAGTPHPAGNHAAAGHRIADRSDRRHRRHRLGRFGRQSGQLTPASSLRPVCTGWHPGEERIVRQTPKPYPGAARGPVAKANCTQLCPGLRRGAVGSVAGVGKGSVITETGIPAGKTRVQRGRIALLPRRSGTSSRNPKPAATGTKGFVLRLFRG